MQFIEFPFSVLTTLYVNTSKSQKMFYKSLHSDWFVLLDYMWRRVWPSG